MLTAADCCLRVLPDVNQNNTTQINPTTTQNNKTVTEGVVKMIDSNNVHLFDKFNDLIHQAGDLAAQLQRLQAELRELEADVAHTLSDGGQDGP